jgi:hypothetical protein
MEQGSFKMLEHDISVETCSEILKWAERNGQKEMGI